MADQDWKTGGLNREKYVVLKPCLVCRGTRLLVGRTCYNCHGQGAVPPRDENAQYFVLRIDSGPDGPHDPHARAALTFYAYHVAPDNQQFADDIREWLEST